MDAAKLNAAIKEAKRFLEKAKGLKDVEVAFPEYGFHPRESGAVRRASMDLTRALADLRRPA